MTDLLVVLYLIQAFRFLSVSRRWNVNRGQMLYALACEFARGSTSLYECLLLLFLILSSLFCPQKGGAIYASFLILLLSLAGDICPLTVYDRNGFKAMLHFSRDPAPGRPDVLVMVLSMLSTSAQPIKDIVFQAAVPKVRSQWWIKGSVTTQKCPEKEVWHFVLRICLVYWKLHSSFSLNCEPVIWGCLWPRCLFQCGSLALRERNGAPDMLL